MKFETDFKILFSLDGKELTAKVKRFSLQTTQYLVQVENKDKKEVQYPLVLSGNKKKGDLEYLYLSKKKRSAESITLAIKDYCSSHHIDLV